MAGWTGSTAGGHYIIGEKLRDSREARETVPAKRGRFTPVRENLEIKEGIVSDGERRRRFILASNPEEAKRDKATRERTVKRIEEALAGAGDWTGKHMISTHDDTLSPEDAALGYRQLLEVERAFRTLKTTLDLRPVCHRKDARIQAHAFLCFLALLLVRNAERKTGLTWDWIRAQMERIRLGEFFSQEHRTDP